MSKDKIREHLTRIEAADRLASLSKQLREGAVALGDGTKVPVTDDVELKAELKDDKLELEFRWQKANIVSAKTTANV